MVVGLVANLLYEDRTRTKDQVVALLRSTTSRYPITNCPAGYCYGFSYKCTILSTNEIDEENEKNVGEDEEFDHDDAIEGEVPIMGCCKAVRPILQRLVEYCATLSLNDCLDDSNVNYCFVDSQC